MCSLEFSGGDRVAGCFCVRNLSECHSRSRLCGLFELSGEGIFSRAGISPKPGLQTTCLEESSGYMFLTVKKKNYLPVAT